MLAAKPKLPADFADKTWGKLQAAVTAVHQKQPVSCSLEDLYRVINDTCNGLISIEYCGSVVALHAMVATGNLSKEHEFLLH